MSESEKLFDKVKDLVEQGFGRTIIARKLGISDSKATRIIKRIKVGISHTVKETLESLESLPKSSVSRAAKGEAPKTGSILVIGDAHAKPGVSNERFTKLGKLIVDLQPDVIVQIGDFLDFPSLSHYDVGKKSFEGRRYRLDLEAGWDALQRIQFEIDSYNKTTGNKYTPKKYVTLGNHENRINKAVNSDPKLDGTLSTDNIRFEEYGWETIPFLEPLELMGVTFQHYFTSGSMDRAISTENTGRTILKKYHSSCFAGHTHKLDLAWEANAKGDMMMAGTVGCYFDHIEEWQSLNAQKHFWRGVVLLEDVKNGVVGNMKFVKLDYINRTY